MAVQRAFTNLFLDWNWFDPSDWAATDFSTAIPGSDDDVQIAISAVNSQPVTIQNGDAVARTVTIGEGDQLLVGQSGSLTTSFDIALNNVLSNSSGNELIVQSGGVVTVGAGGGGKIQILAPGSGVLIGGTGGVGNGAASGTLFAASVIGGDATDFVKFNVTDGAYTFSVPILGAGGVIQEGKNSKVILTGANSYTGTTTVTSGTLQLGNGGVDGASGAGAFVNHSALTFDISSSLVISGVISGAGLLFFDGGGAYALTAQNTFTGGFSINANTTVQVVGTGTLGSGAIFSSGRLQFVDSAPLTVANAISGAGVVDVVTSSVTFGGATTYSGATNIGFGFDPATLRAGAANVFSATSDFVLAKSGVLDINGFNETIGGLTDTGNGGATAIVDNSATQAATLTISEQQSSEFFEGTIQNSGFALSLVVTQGVGSIYTLTGNNTYTGTTEVAGGVLQVGAGGVTGSLGSGAISIDAGAKLLFDRSDTIQIDNLLTGQGGLEVQAGLTFFTANNDLYSGQVTIDSGALLDISGGGTTGTLGTAAIANSGTLDIDRTDVATIANAISGTGAVFVFDGTAVFTGANNYSGATGLFFNGNLKGGGANVFSANSVVTVGTGSTLDLGGFNQTIAGLSGSGAVISGLLTISGGGGASFSGTHGAGALKLTKTGAGTQTLTNPGAIQAVITGGTLQIGDGAGLTLAASNFTDNANLAFNQVGGTTLGTNVTISGTGSVNYTGVYTIISSHISYSGASTIAASSFVQIGTGAGNLATFGTGGVVDNGRLTLDRTGATTFANKISGTGSLRQAVGTVTLTGANTYSGGSEVLSGATLVAGALNAFGSGNLTVDANATVDLGGFSELSSTTLNNGTLTESVGNNTFGGPVTNNGVISVAGTGTLQFSGPVVNNNVISISGLDVVTLVGNVTGSGNVQLAGSAQILCGQSFNQNVSCSGSGFLGIALNQSYTGTISGARTLGIGFFSDAFAAGEHVAWRSTSNGVQTWALEDAANNVIETLHFAGYYLPADFSVGSNGGHPQVNVLHGSRPLAYDFNHDSMADILWHNTNGQLSQWDPNGAGGFTKISNPGAATSWSVSGVGDFNGDGVADVLWRNANG